MEAVAREGEQIDERRGRHGATPGEIVAALAIAGVTIGLRLWRLGWGVDDGGWFPDEAYLTRRAIAFVHLTPQAWDYVYTPLTGYVAGIITAAANAAGWIPVPITQTSPHVLLIARLVCAGTGCATVWLVWVLARRIGDRTTALVAAAFTAVAPFHVMYGHIASTDLPLAAWFVAAPLVAYALATRADARTAVASGLIVALAASTKLTGLTVAAPVVWALGERMVSRPRDQTTNTLRLATIALATLVVTIVVVCLPYVLHLDHWLRAMAIERRLQSERAWDSENNYLVPSLGWRGTRVIYPIVATTPYMLGWPLAAVALIGVGRALHRRDLGDRLLLATLLPYFLVMSWSLLTYPRYLLPLVPVLTILAARALDLARRPRAPRMAVVILVLLYSATLSASQVARFSTRQQRELATWLAAYARQVGAERPPSIAIAVAPEPYFRLDDPLAAVGVTYRKLKPGPLLDDPADVLVMPEWRAIAIRRDRRSPAALRDLERLDSGAAGYRVAARWPTTYFQRDLYVWLDPAFAGDLWQGEIGFTVYVRTVSASRRRSLRSVHPVADVAEASQALDGLGVEHGLPGG